MLIIKAPLGKVYKLIFVCTCFPSDSSFQVALLQKTYHLLCCVTLLNKTFNLNCYAQSLTSAPNASKKVKQIFRSGCANLQQILLDTPCIYTISLIVRLIFIIYPSRKKANPF